MRLWLGEGGRPPSFKGSLRRRCTLERRGKWDHGERKGGPGGRFAGEGGKELRDRGRNQRLSSSSSFGKQEQTLFKDLRLEPRNYTIFTQNSIGWVGLLPGIRPRRKVKWVSSALQIFFEVGYTFAWYPTSKKSQEAL